MIPSRARIMEPRFLSPPGGGVPDAKSMYMGFIYSTGGKWRIKRKAEYIGSCKSHLKLRQLDEQGEEDIEPGTCAFGKTPILTW